MKRYLKFVILLPLFFWVGQASAAEVFQVESPYDSYSRSELEATLVKSTNEINFYIESHWWDGLSQREKNIVDEILYNSSVEFERKIRPKMEEFFGSMPDHPVDKSQKLTVLFHRMVSSAGGYFNSGDQYKTTQYPRSNEKNLVYINASYIASGTLDGLLAHEYTHLITFNAKDKKYRVNEATWLNEARAEYMPTWLGYDNDQEIAKRLTSFLRSPETSLTQWENTAGNYGVVNIFTHYLVDHYGIEILSDSFKSNKVGIESINEALAKNGYKESFADIFTDWTIAVLINDCSLGQKYCFLTEELKELRLAPSTNFLPISYSSSYSTRRSAKEWSAVWQRVVGGKGDLYLEFEGATGLDYRVPYLICKGDDCTINFLSLNSLNQGRLTVREFDKNETSIIFIPSLVSDNNGREAIFSWKVSSMETESVKIEELLAIIAQLQAEVDRLRALLPKPTFNNNLFFGSRGEEVSKLQQFLKDQGVYPEGLVTGNFLTLTKTAVIRFQEKYAAEVLRPIGLSKGTGFVGDLTRKKINELLR